jgi:WD40 repeat protein
VVVYENRAVVVEPATARIVKTFSQQEVHCFAWSSDGKQFKSGSKGRLRHVWNAETGELIGPVDEPAPLMKGNLGDLTDFGPATTHDLVFWDPGTKDFRVSFVPLEDSHWAAISPDGHYRVDAGLDDELVYIAEADNGEMLVFSPKEFAEKFGWKNDPARIGQRHRQVQWSK